jgi:hypothetical protein
MEEIKKVLVRGAEFQMQSDGSLTLPKAPASKVPAHKKYRLKRWRWVHISNLIQAISARGKDPDSIKIETFRAEIVLQQAGSEFAWVEQAHGDPDAYICFGSISQCELRSAKNKDIYLSYTWYLPLMQGIERGAVEVIGDNVLMADGSFATDIAGLFNHHPLVLRG